jgi:uroporphyrinogen-III decarboxylase
MRAGSSTGRKEKAMTTTSTEIQGRESLRVDAARLFIAAAILVSAIGVGVILDRVNSPGTTTVSEQPISTAFLADTSQLRLNVMEKMNSIAPEVSAFVGNNNTPTEVMNHMNEISARGVSITLRVMRHMNELSAP